MSHSPRFLVAATRSTSDAVVRGSIDCVRLHRRSYWNECECHVSHSGVSQQPSAHFRIGRTRARSHFARVPSPILPAATPFLTASLVR